MITIKISPDNGGYDISVYHNGIKIDKTWAMNRIIAERKRNIFTEYYSSTFQVETQWKG